MFQMRGSVLPKSLFWAFPCSALAAASWFYQNEIAEDATAQGVRKDAAKQVMTGFTAVLGFLLIFRTTKAYGRYWECAMYLQKARGEWYNATSNLFSFCSPRAEKVRDVKRFQQQLVRLISLVFCSAIGEISSMSVPQFEILDPLLGQDTLVFLQSKTERSEVVMTWIQRLVVDNIRTNTIEIAPPIVSRVFQEFSMGIVNVAAAKKINFIPFPFPYSQMMQLLLIFQAIVQPIVAGYAYHGWWVAAGSTFVVILLSWSIHFISVEIEMPFGDDANDLPLGDLVKGMNDSLVALMEDMTQRVPFMHIPDVDKVSTLTPKDRIPWNTSCPLESERGKAGGVPAEEKMQDVVVTVAVPSQPVTPLEKEKFSADDSVDTASPISNTAIVSVQIENHLAKIGDNLSVCPRMAERLNQIGADVSHLGMVGGRLSERLDRMDKAMLGRPGMVGADTSQIWFCGEPQGRVPELRTADEMMNGRWRLPGAPGIHGPGIGPGASDEMADGRAQPFSQQAQSFPQQAQPFSQQTLDAGRAQHIPQQGSRVDMR